MDRRHRIVRRGCPRGARPCSRPVRARRGAAHGSRDAREWLAGDLHVHTCYSHDAYCGPSDDNTGPEELYTLSGDVEERFAEAALRGLDYLAITDHNDVRSVDHPGFGAYGVIPIPGYESVAATATPRCSVHATVLDARGRPGRHLGAGRGRADCGWRVPDQPPGADPGWKPVRSCAPTI